MAFNYTETAEEIRNSEYYRTEPEHPKQDNEILTVVGLFRDGVGASGIFKHLQEKYPLTSVRRSLNTLLNQGKIINIGRIDSQLFNSSETKYKVKIFQTGLF